MQRRGNIINLGIKELRSLWRDKVLLLFVFFRFYWADLCSGFSHVDRVK